MKKNVLFLLAILALSSESFADNSKNLEKEIAQENQPNNLSLKNSTEEKDSLISEMRVLITNQEKIINNVNQLLNTKKTNSISFVGSEIKATSNIVDTDADGYFNDDSDDTTAFKYNLQLGLGDNTQVNINSDTHDAFFDKGHHAGMGIIIKRKEGDVEGSFATALDYNGEKGIREDMASSSTYLKWNVTPKLAATIYPFNFNTGSNFSYWRWVSTAQTFWKTQTAIPGIKFDYGNYNFGFGADSVGGKTFVAVKAGFFKPGRLTLMGNYFGNFFDENSSNFDPMDKLGTGGYVGVVTQELAGKAIYGLNDKLSLNAEIGVNILHKDITTINRNGFAFNTGIDYNLNSKVKPYGKVKFSNEGMLRDADRNFSYTDQTAYQKGNLTTFVLGSDYIANNRIILNLEGKYKVSEEKIYESNKEKSAMVLSTSATYKF